MITVLFFLLIMVGIMQAGAYTLIEGLHTDRAKKIFKDITLVLALVSLFVLLRLL